MKICAISDLHGSFPVVPSCDLLIIAGDVCPDGFGGVWARHKPEVQLDWFNSTFLPWTDRQDAEKILITWGNHDFCGHDLLNASFGCERVEVVCDRLVEFKDKKLWLTPWSNEFMQWAFMKTNDELGTIYAQIPEGIDVLVSHQPPQGYGDLYADFKTGKMEHVASSALLYHMERAKPEILICGHLHGGYGTYKHGRTHIFNVSVKDEQYQMVNPATEFEL